MYHTTGIFCLIIVSLLKSAVGSQLHTHCSGNAANIMFVMDSSSSIWIVDYRRQLEFVKNLVDTFDIGAGKSQVRVGAITFSNNAHLEFALDRYQNRTELKKAIAGIPYRTGMTNTAAALHLVRSQLKPFFRNSTAPFVVIVITDGLSRDPKATRKEARKLHKLGVHAYAIGVGYHYSLDELKAIASDPINNLHQVSSYSALKGIVRNFNIKTCKDITTSRAPSTETTKVTTQATAKLTWPPSTTIRTTTTRAPPPTTTTSPATTSTVSSTTTAPTTTTASTTTSTLSTTRLNAHRRRILPRPTERIRHWSYRNRYIPKPVVDQSDLAQRDEGSTITFGYDLLSMGAYRANMIAQFINALLPYTAYENFGLVSYAYCPEKYNIPVTSLTNRNNSITSLRQVTPGRLPGVADVIRRMRRDLYGQSYYNRQHGIRGRQSAVLFVDPSITRITPNVMHEARRLKQQGSKLFLVNVGQKRWPRPRTLRSLSSQPHQNYIFSSPTYENLLSRVKRTPFQFRSLCNKYLSG